jgi:hypothetical protein
MVEQEAKPPDPKEVEWYSVNLAAWHTTRLERDKSLLTLSAGGIALLVTLLTAVGIRSYESLLLFALALAAFVLCLIAVLWIFNRNSTHIEDAVNHGVSHDPVLAALDVLAVSTFVAGVVLSCVIGMSAAIRSLHTKEPNMSAEKKTVYVGDSVNGILGMRPGQGDLRRSLNGVANMAPKQNTTASPQPAQTPTQTAAPAPPANVATAKKG